MTVATKELQVDWFRVIVDLERSGLSHKAIAEHAGIGGGTIHGLKVLGAEPLFWRGVRILVFWMERTGKSAAEVPTIK